MPNQPVANALPSDNSMIVDNDAPPTILKPEVTTDKQSTGHGPWMLMSYKNKKRDVATNGHVKGQASTGSCFYVLGNEDGDTVVNEAETFKNPVGTKGSEVTMANVEEAVLDPISPNHTTSEKTLTHPMKDITNGNFVGKNNNRILGNPKNTKKTSVGAKAVKGSTSGTKNPSISTYDIPPTQVHVP
ncbi:hypothetical protein M0R45_036249 [Rubus argutus]|uniref:Uncharacterized protein n=1 Tax=Rubus argutus TaxID=59490 RepID=A0AAW1VZX1_RUBAR